MQFVQEIFFTMPYCRPSRHPSATICTSVFEAPDIMMSAIILFISHGLHLENGLKIENMNNSLNPLYSDGFSHIYRYNNYGTAHCVLKGSTGRIF